MARKILALILITIIITDSDSKKNIPVLAACYESVPVDKNQL